MIAYKFLERGAVGPFTRFAWPTDGKWVDAVDIGGGRGIHACRARDLPYWISDELWRVEMADPVRERETQIEGPRGRLLTRVDGWDPRIFASACAFRTRDLALEALGNGGRLAQASSLDELVAAARAFPSEDRFQAEMVGYVIDAAVRAREGHAGSSSHTAAVAAVALHGPQAAFAAERAWQARWLTERLKLA
jgi:hypothetical protein